jgi:hypothetical protein
MSDLWMFDEFDIRYSASHHGHCHPWFAQIIGASCVVFFSVLHWPLLHQLALIQENLVQNIDAIFFLKCYLQIFVQIFVSK